MNIRMKIVGAHHLLRRGDRASPSWPRKAEGPGAAEAAQAKASLYKISLIVAGGIITLAVVAGAFCQAKAISSACEGISRNPAARPAHPVPSPAGPDPDRDAGHLRPARHVHHPDGQVGPLRLIT